MVQVMMRTPCTTNSPLMLTPAGTMSAYKQNTCTANPVHTGGTEYMCYHQFCILGNIRIARHLLTTLTQFSTTEEQSIGNGLY